VYIATSAAIALASGAAGAHPSWRNLGSYERQALAEASGGRCLDFEPDPEGKLIASIRVRNLNVFRRGTTMSWANYLHITSTEQSIRQELTFRVGDRFVWTNMQQTLRLLRDPFYTSLAVIVPLRSTKPGYVDVLVVTRDRWSLRPNSELELQSGKITSLEALPADNNFLGRRKRLALEIIADQGQYSFGPRYIDPNVLGKRWRLDTVAALIFNRTTDAVEGGKMATLLAYPLWTLQRDWGGKLSFDFDSHVFREFEGEVLRRYVDPVTGSAFPFEYRLRTSNLASEVVRQFGRTAISRLALGYRLGSKRPSVHGAFTGTADELSRFGDAVLPRSERTSGLYVRYEAFDPTYIIYRNIDNFDLPEEAQTGPRGSVEVSSSAKVMGATVNFVQISATAGWWIDFHARAYLDIQATATTRFGGSTLEDNGVSGTVKLASAPFWRGNVRVVTRVELALRLNDADNVRFATGGDTGLRGYPVSAYLGRARAVGNLELRTRPFKVWFMRAGVLAFWDVGHAAPSFPRLRMHHDVGFGVRVLIPQVSSELFRVDWAFPFQGTNPGWPGRISAGFEHIF